jgi:energy-coupling factor transport system substrate-specific component
MRQLLKYLILALLSAMLFLAQLSLWALPNVELVTLLLMSIAISFSFKDGVLVVLLFTLLEGLYWGFADWTLGYLWIWSLLVILTQITKPVTKFKASRMAILGGLFGLAFGFLFAIQHALLYGLNMGISYWIMGIGFDLIHGFANYTLILLLFDPVNKLLSQLIRKAESRYGHRHHENGR